MLFIWVYTRYIPDPTFFHFIAPPCHIHQYMAFSSSYYYYYLSVGRPDLKAPSSLGWNSQPVATCVQVENLQTPKLKTQGAKDEAHSVLRCKKQGYRACPWKLSGWKKTKPFLSMLDFFHGITIITTRTIFVIANTSFRLSMILETTETQTGATVTPPSGVFSTFGPTRWIYWCIDQVDILQIQKTTLVLQYF